MRSNTDSHSPKTVLVVDDDTSYIKIMKEELQDQGYRVVCGYDGVMALDLADAQKPDIILLDVNMPNRNGIEAFAELRKNEKTSTIPVIFITDVVSEKIDPVLQSSARVGHIKKPADIDDVNSLVRVFLDEYPVSYAC